MAGISGKGRNELATLLRPGRELIAVEDVAKQLHISKPAAGKRLARWAEQGWLRRVRRDFYIPVPTEATDPRNWTADPMVLADAVLTPCYFTGWTTANHWGLTEQLFRTTVVKTTQRIRSSNPTFAGNNYLLIHTDNESMSWGMDYLWKDGTRLTIADPARTILDILDNPKIGGGIRLVSEIIDAYASLHEVAELTEYADRLGNGAVYKRLGYLMTLLRPDRTDFIEECRSKITSGFSLLDPSAHKSGERLNEWGLIANVKVQQTVAS